MDMMVKIVVGAVVVTLTLCLVYFLLQVGVYIVLGMLLFVGLEAAFGKQARELWFKHFGDNDSKKGNP